MRFKPARLKFPIPDPLGRNYYQLNGSLGGTHSEFFLRPPRAGLRGHAYRLLQGPSRLRRRSGAFSVRVVKYWNRLPAHLVLEPSVSIIKKQLDRHWFEIFPAAPV